MDFQLPPSPFVLVVALAIALLFVLVGVALAGWWARVQSRSRNRVAQRGEVEAEHILAEAGFAIVSRQTTARWRMAVDGEEVTVGVRADLIVERRGKRYVAEVKTGERAPEPCLPATRRQLLEYSLVFGGGCVLLVDVPGRAVHAVTFPEFDRRVSERPARGTR